MGNKFMTKEHEVEQGESLQQNCAKKTGQDTCQKIKLDFYITHTHKIISNRLKTVMKTDLKAQADFTGSRLQESSMIQPH